MIGARASVCITEGSLSDDHRLTWFHNIKIIEQSCPCLVITWQKSLRFRGVFCGLMYHFLSPIFKKGSSSDANNYRPISLLCIPGKILEEVVSDTLNNHMETQGLLSHKQWGFWKNYSTESLLLHLTETWKNALDRGLKIGVLLIDFRKAFDTVNHTILLEKLKAIGISGDLFSWLEDYMSARKQFVQLSGYQSGSKTITYGVPHGSILGPKLFSIFVNDLPESITSGDLFMFADDTTIFTIGKNTDKIILTLQSVLDQVCSWCQSHRLIAHESKSEALIISNQTLAHCHV